MPENTINLTAGNHASFEGVAIGDRNKIISHVQAQGHVVQADHSQVHIGDIYYYFEVPKSDVITKEPYKFLSTYGLADEDIFFGRKQAIAELSSQILDHKLVIINGKSGSGKSSLMHAGVTPTLLRNNHLVIHITDYVTTPVTTIHEAIQGDLESPLVIFLDQFERFFIYLPASEQQRFTAAFKEWLADDKTNVRFVIAIRMDFFGRLSEFQPVIPNFFQQNAVFPLLPLNRAEAREAIENPVEVLNIRIVYEPELLDTLLDSLLEDAEIEPAQLQIVCDELYRRAQASNAKIINAALYDAAGGVKGMLENYLQRKLAEYTPDDDEVKAILKQMIAPVEVSAGIRSFVAVAQISERIKLPQPDVERLIARLVDDRLIEQKQGEDTYSIAHEYLAGQVQQWFDPRETALRRARDILDHAMRYDTLMEYKEASQVKEYASDLELNDTESALLQRSLRKHTLGVWLRWGIVTVITLFAIIAAVAGFYANLQRKDALFQKDQAKQAQNRAENKEKEAVAAQKKAEQAEKTTRQQLSLTYFNNGMTARELLKDWLKASHYFMKTAAFTDDPALARNAHLVGAGWINNLEITAILPHQYFVMGAVFNRDETRILTWSYDRTARVWDSTTGKPLTPPLMHDGWVRGAVFNRDETRILTWSDDSTARVWDSRTGQPMTPPLALNGWLKGAIFNRDETSVLAWSYAGTARLWDAATGQPVTPLLEHKDRNGAAISWMSETGSIQSPISKGGVNGAIFSHDETRILTWSGNAGSDYGLARVWDSVTGQPVTPPLEHQQAVNGALFNRDDTRVLTWSNDGTARVWNSTTGRPLTPPLKQEDWVNGAIFSQDESRILTWGGNPYAIEGNGGVARVWDSTTGQPLTPPLEHENPVNGAVFNRDVTRVLTWTGNPGLTWYEKRGRGEEAARVWDSVTGQPLTPPLAHKDYVYGAAFSRDEACILTWSRDGTAQVWDSKTGELLTAPLERVVFSADKTCVLTWSKDGTPRVWDIMPLGNTYAAAVFSRDATRTLTWGEDVVKVEQILTTPALNNATKLATGGATGQPLIPPLTHSGIVSCARFSQDESRVLTCSDNGSVRLWDSATGQPLTPPLENAGTGAIFSRDETRILTWSQNGTARAWDSTTGQPVTPPLEHKGDVYDAIFSQDETRILTWSADGTAQLWNSRTGQPLTPPLQHQGAIYGAVFNQDETRILTWSADSTARVWDSATGQPVTPPLKHSYAVDGAMFTRDGARIVTRSSDNTARVWDSTNGQPLTPPMKDAGASTVFNQDETRILTISGNAARVWDSRTGQPQTPPMAHNNELNGAIFNRDGMRVLTWSLDGTARVWDSATGQPLTPPLAHEQNGWIKGAIFSQDETRLLTWSAGGTARIWELQTDADFPREHLIQQLEVQTGTRLNDVGEIEVLTAEEWQTQHDQYEKIAQEHLKICNFPRANLWLKHLMSQPGSCDQIGDWLHMVNPAIKAEVAFLYARTCLARGDFYFQEQEYDRANRAFNTTLQLQLDHSTTNPILLSAAYSKLGRVLIETGQDVAKGIEYGRKSLEVQPYQAEGWAAETLAAGYLKQGNPAETLKVLEHALATALNDDARKRLEEMLKQVK